VKTNVLDIGKCSAGNPGFRRKSISEDGSNHRRTEGGFEELNVPSKPKQK
jgi:hypothetical protein